MGLPVSEYAERVEKILKNAISGDDASLYLICMQRKGMKKVLFGCYKDNIASVCTIKKNGGMLSP